MIPTTRLRWVDPDDDDMSGFAFQGAYFGERKKLQQYHAPEPDRGETEGKWVDVEVVE